MSNAFGKMEARFLSSGKTWMCGGGCCLGSSDRRFLSLRKSQGEEG